MTILAADANLPRYVLPLLGLYYLSSAFGFVFPLLIPLLLNSGFSPAGAAGVQGLAFLFSGLVQPALGRRLDANRLLETSIIASFGITLGVAVLLAEKAHIIWQLIGIGSFLLGSGTIVTIAGRYIDGSVSADLRPKVATWSYVTLNAGIATAALVASQFLQRFRTELLIVDALTSILFCIGVVVLAPKPTNAAAGHTAIPAAGLIVALRRQTRLAVGIVLMFMTIFCHLSAIPLLYDRLQIGVISSTTLMLIVNTLTAVVVGLAIARYKRLSHNVKLLGASVLLGLGHAVVPLGDTPLTLTLVTMLWTVGEVLAFPAMTVLILRNFADTGAGFASGLRTMLMRWGLILTPLIASILSYQPVWVFSAVFGLMPIAAWFLLREQPTAISCE